MTIYDPKKHDLIALKWFLDLRADQPEFRNLFTERMRDLTPFLNWCATEVKIMFEVDGGGIWAAAWVEPNPLSPEHTAYFGAWIRKEKRGTISAVKFIRHCYDEALKLVDVLIGVTKQAGLHDLHLALGYEYVGAIPQGFDGSDARVYVLTKESRAAARYAHGRRSRGHHQIHSDVTDPADSGEIRDDRYDGLASDSGQILARAKAENRQLVRGVVVPDRTKDVTPIDAPRDNGHNANDDTARSLRRRRIKQSSRQSSDGVKRREQPEPQPP